MGDYRIVIDAVGGHGCQRNIKNNEAITQNCESASCPDCAARRFVAELAKTNNVVAARLEHWPLNMLRHDGAYGDHGGSPGGPIDDLKTGMRAGSF